MIQYLVALRGNTVTLTVEQDDGNEVLCFMCPSCEIASVVAEGIVQRLRDHGVDMQHVSQEEFN